MNQTLQSIGVSSKDGVQVIGLSVLRSRLPILCDIDLVASKGETIAIMGPNGAGKSTLLACLAGALRPTTGEVRVFGDRPDRIAAKRQIGFVGHQTGLYGDLTVSEILLFAAHMQGVEFPRECVRALLLECGLERFANSFVEQLSQGARRRAAIARALVHGPSLVLLDEPFVSLDAEGADWLRCCFQHWRQIVRTVCFATHDRDQARLLADRIVWLEGGRVVSKWPLNELAICSRQSA
jgi:ABC-type multidrug transport system ATPase subunit